MLVRVGILVLSATFALVSAVNDVKTDWEAYTSVLPIPDVVDATNGGSFDFQIARTTHHWTSDGTVSGDVYGYGLKNSQATFPGPTIKVKRGVSISITWWNMLSAPHLLSQSVEPTLTVENSACYPKCGVPVVTHIHGLESAPKYDGLPTSSIYQNQSIKMIYTNNQLPSTKLYHDHAQGLTRLNVWSGLAGLYIIHDEQLDKKLNVHIETDIPLVIADRIITNKGELKYSDDNCKPDVSVWVPESFGNVNTVNGVVLPYVDLPTAQVRFRLANIANARHYNFTIPFADKCLVIASDSGYVHETQPLERYMTLFPYERKEIVCDFSNERDGTTFEIKDLPADDQAQYDDRILQIRIKSTLKKPSMKTKHIPKQLVQYKSLQQIFQQTRGKERTLTLGEMQYSENCPLQDFLEYKYQQINVSTPMATLECTRGTVEKWHFKNPTDDPHPFHWHVVNAQCGDTVDSINTNELKDVVVIPNAGSDRDPQTFTQVCYVACTPDEFLVENAARGPRDYNFDTTDPYLAHCHILEHEENAMMAFFKLTDNDDTTQSSDDNIEPNNRDHC